MRFCVDEHCLARPVCVRSSRCILHCGCTDCDHCGTQYALRRAGSENPRHPVAPHIEIARA